MCHFERSEKSFMAQSSIQIPHFVRNDRLLLLGLNGYFYGFAFHVSHLTSHVCLLTLFYNFIN
jgi:hypothetical protein